MASGIYKIRNIQNEKLYVGSAVKLSSRKGLHFFTLRKGEHHNPKLQAAYNKYGESSFVFEVIEYVEPAQLIQREQYYIDTLQPFYNILPVAGSSLGREVSAETRDKIGKAFRGRNLTDDHKAKIGEASRGRRHSDETREKLRAVNAGKTLSSEHKEKIRAAHAGTTRKPLSDETRQKLSGALKGRVFSQETKEKMRLAKLGKKRNATTEENS